MNYLIILFEDKWDDFVEASKDDIGEAFGQLTLFFLLVLVGLFVGGTLMVILLSFPMAVMVIMICFALPIWIARRFF